MFNWFFNSLLKIAKKKRTTVVDHRQKKDDNNVSKTEEYKKKYEKGIYNLLNDVFKDKRFDNDLFYNLTSDNEIDTALKKNYSTNSFISLLVQNGIKENFDNLRYCLLGSILNKANKTVLSDATKAKKYVLDRLSGEKGEEQTEISGDVTQLFDNLKKSVFGISNESQKDYTIDQSGNVVRNTETNQEETEDKPAKEVSDSGVGDPATLLEQKEEQEELRKKQKTLAKKRSFLENLFEKLKNAGYKNTHPELLSALTAYIKSSKKRVTDGNLPENIRIQLAQQGVGDSEEAFDNLKDMISYELDNQILGNIDGKETTLGESEDVLALLKATNKIYSSLTPEGNGKNFYIEFNSLVDLKDNLDKIIDRLSNTLSNDEINAFKNSVGYDEVLKIVDSLKKNDEGLIGKLLRYEDKLATVRSIEPAKRDDLSKTIAPFKTEKELEKEIKKLKSQLKSTPQQFTEPIHKVEQSLRVLRKRIKKINDLRSKRAPELEEKACRSVFKTLTTDERELIKKINSLPENEEQKTSPDQVTYTQQEKQDMIASLKAEFEFARQATLVEANKKLTKDSPASVKNKLFADTLLRCSVESVLNAISGLKDFGEEIANKTEQVNPFDVLKSKYSSTDAIVDILDTPSNFYNYTPDQQDFLYRRLVEDILPEFKHICTDKPYNERATDFNRNFLTNTGKYYNFNLDTAFDSDEIAENVFADGDFFSILFDIKKENPSQFPELLEHGMSKNMEIYDAYSFDKDDIIKCINDYGNWHEVSVNSDGTIKSINPIELNKPVIPNPTIYIDEDTGKYMLANYSVDNYDRTSGYVLNDSDYTISEVLRPLTPKKDDNGQIIFRRLEDVFAGETLPRSTKLEEYYKKLNETNQDSDLNKKNISESNTINKELSDVEIQDILTYVINSLNLDTDLRELKKANRTEEKQLKENLTNKFKSNNVRDLIYKFMVDELNTDEKTLKAVFPSITDKIRKEFTSLIDSIARKNEAVREHARKYYTGNGGNVLRDFKEQYNLMVSLFSIKSELREDLLYYMLSADTDLTDKERDILTRDLVGKPYDGSKIPEVCDKIRQSMEADEGTYSDFPSERTITYGVSLNDNNRRSVYKMIEDEEGADKHIKQYLGNEETGTEEENDEAKQAGFNFIGLKVTAAFFKFAESDDNYKQFDVSRENKEQGLIEGFEFNEENTEDSLHQEKKDSEEFSMERLAKVLSIIKDDSSDKWQEIQTLVQQSSPKVGEDLLTFLNLWSENDWNAEKALRQYNASAVETRNRSYFWKMFRDNVWPQLQNNPSVVNIVNKLSQGKPAEETDVDTVEYK